MTTLSMLWESVDAEDTLRHRFGFESPAVAADWVTTTLARTHGLTVVSVNHVVLSAHNLLAFAVTDDTALLVKCCAVPAAHASLLQLGQLVRWAGVKGMPVSTPLRSTSGDPQVLADHLTFQVQHQIAGRLLDPTDLDQARNAGEVLARLQATLALSPEAHAFPRSPRAGHRGLDTLPEEVRDDVAGVDRLLAQSSDAVTYSLCHNDFRAANVLQNEGTVTAILDFEEAGHNDPVTELATATVLLATRFRHWRPSSLASQDAFHEGYRAFAPMSRTQEHRLRLLTLRRTLELTADAIGSEAEEAWRSSAAAWRRRASEAFPSLGDAGGDAVR